MTANLHASNVRVFHRTPSVESRLVDAADQYEHALADARSGCCGGEHCPCSAGPLAETCHHAGRTTSCDDCVSTAAEMLDVAAVSLAGLIVEAGLAGAVAEAAGAAR